MRTLVLIALLFVAFPVAARAERAQAGGQVVHSRRAPVVAHKMVPPFQGKHAYSGRGRAGR